MLAFFIHISLFSLYKFICINYCLRRFCVYFVTLWIRWSRNNSNFLCAQKMQRFKGKRCHRPKEKKPCAPNYVYSRLKALYRDSINYWHLFSWRKSVAMQIHFISNFTCSFFLCFNFSPVGQNNLKRFGFVLCDGNVHWCGGFICTSSDDENEKELWCTSTERIPLLIDAFFRHQLKTKRIRHCFWKHFMPLHVIVLLLLFFVALFFSIHRINKIDIW